MGVEELIRGYRTNETALATYLICQGHKLLQIDYSNPPRYEFVFSNNNGIQDEITKYLTQKALVNPAAYQKINRKLMRLVKTRIQWWQDDDV